MRRRALSLLEIVVAISLIYLLVTFVIQLLPSNLYALMRGQSRLTAESLANSQLQVQAHRPFSALSLGLSQQLPDLSRDSKIYHSLLEVLPAGAEDPDHLRLVRVTVSWADRSSLRKVSREQWVHSIL